MYILLSMMESFQMKSPVFEMFRSLRVKELHFDYFY